MQAKKISIIFLLMCTPAVYAEKSDIYNPYSIDDREKLDWNSGVDADRKLTHL